MIFREFTDDFEFHLNFGSRAACKMQLTKTRTSGIPEKNKYLDKFNLILDDNFFVDFYGFQFSNQFLT